VAPRSTASRDPVASGSGVLQPAAPAKGLSVSAAWHPDARSFP